LFGVAFEQNIVA